MYTYIYIHITRYVCMHIRVCVCVWGGGCITLKISTAAKPRTPMATAVSGNGLDARTFVCVCVCVCVCVSECGHAVRTLLYNSKTGRDHIYIYIYIYMLFINTTTHPHKAHLVVQRKASGDHEHWRVLLMCR